MIPFVVLIVNYTNNIIKYTYDRFLDDIAQIHHAKNVHCAYSPEYTDVRFAYLDINKGMEIIIWIKSNM